MKRKTIVRNRADLLWQCYRKYGRLTMADVKRITGQPHFALYNSFSTHGVDAPPIHDSWAERARRKSESLKAKMESLEQDYLLISQAAQVLNVPQNKVNEALTQIENRGFSVPVTCDD